MTTLYTITCGLDTNGHDVDARQIALDLAAECFPHGHTIREVSGRWMSENGPVDEASLEIIWMASDQQKANGEAHTRVSWLAGQYKVRAFQEAVMITTQEVHAVFV
jgi:hypothetical protein